MSRPASHRRALARLPLARLAFATLSSLLALAVLGACGDAEPDAAAPTGAPSAATAAALPSERHVLHVETPHADDAALLLALDGARVDSVTADGASVDVIRAASGAGAATRLVLSAGAGTLARATEVVVWTRPGARLAASLTQAAAAGSMRQRALDGYAVRVAE